MQLILQYEKTVRDLKNEFSQAFPFMKLVFIPRNAAPAPDIQDQIPDAVSIGEVKGALKEGVINISADNTIEEVEQLIKSRVQLPVHLYYRDEQNFWKET